MKTAIRASVQRSLDHRSVLHRAERWAVRHRLAPTGLWYFTELDGRFVITTPAGATVVYEATRDDLTAPSLYWRGYMGDERDEVAVMSRLCRDARHFADVGAYVGFYSLVVAKENPDLRVTAFEPVAANFERLLANAALNGLGDQIEALNVAAAATAGLAPLGVSAVERMPVGGRLSSSVVANEAGLAFVDVMTTTVDAALADEPVDVMKIDVEGAEGDVIVGATETLERMHPTLVMECWHGTDVTTYEPRLRDLGYRFWRFMPEGLTPATHLGEPGQWSNYLCVARPEIAHDLGL